MRQPCWCTKQWQNVAQVLHNSRIKFQKTSFAVVLYTNMAAVTSRENREYCLDGFCHGFVVISGSNRKTSCRKRIESLQHLCQCNLLRRDSPLREERWRDEPKECLGRRLNITFRKPVIRQRRTGLNFSQEV